MKKLIIRGVAFAAWVAGPAFAADLPIEPPLYAERPAAIGLLNWTGFYFGAHLGYAKSPSSADITACEVTVAPVTAATACLGIVGVTTGVPSPPVPLFTLLGNRNGVLGGVQAGANWQTGNAVFGIEGDIAATRRSSSDTMSVMDINGVVFPVVIDPVTGVVLNTGVITAIISDKITSMSTLRGRIGIAAGRALYYATGGGAFWTWSSDVTVTGLGSGSFTQFTLGATAGGGVEFAVSNDWTVKAEYLYAQSTEISSTPFVGRPDVIVRTRIRDNVFRLGVNYMFFTGSVGCRPHVC